MRKQHLIFLVIAVLVMTVPGCSTQDRSTGVYMLLDTSGTYAEELKKAQSIINYLLGTLQPSDSMAVASIDTGSFSEKDIIAKVTFDTRPSVANSQKRKFLKQVNGFVAGVKRSSYTDISGGMLQAIEYLNEANPGKKYILIFSDLKEELAKGYVRDLDFDLTDFHVIALNVTKLRADNMDPKLYMGRVDQWQKKVEDGSGSWKVINDLERLDGMLAAK